MTNCYKLISDSSPEDGKSKTLKTLSRAFMNADDLKKCLHFCRMMSRQKQSVQACKWHILETGKYLKKSSDLLKKAESSDKSSDSDDHSRYEANENQKV